MQITIDKKWTNRIKVNRVKGILLLLLTFITSTFPGISVSSDSDIAHFYGGVVTDQRKQELNDFVTNSVKQPANSHPRLYGTNAEWYQKIQRYEALDPHCDWQGSTGQGTIKNIKSSWDHFSLGGAKCRTGHHGLPSSLADYSLAQSYVNNSITRWNRNDALRIVHLIRQMNYCHSIGSNCLYSQAEINTLSAAFLSYEFSRIRGESKNSSGYFHAWHKGYQGKFFDLGSYPAFKLWTLILDTFWNSPLLLSNDKQFILDELENEIDSYIEIYNLPEDSRSADGRWAIYNGNNWTTILNAAATFWAVTLWHEAPYVAKTRQVLDIVLESGWFHRDYILSDGAYSEGPGYLTVAMNGSLEVNNLLMASFGEPNHAVKWGLMGEKTANWMTENIASDGKFVDFGDVWAREGHSNLYIMDMLYWEELVGLAPYGSVQADACDLEDYFANSYYLQAFYDTWSASSHYARDFYSLASQCQRTQTTSKSLIYPNYQLGTLRKFLPGSTQTALQVTDDNIRNKLADQTFLAANAVDNSLPHREVDFGGLIWSAFGTRLLSDWGYGEISNSYEFFDVTGANGNYIASNAHFLTFAIKHISGELDLSNFSISIKLKGRTVDVNLNDYISALSSEWVTVSIPMSDFSISDVDWIGNGEGIEYIRLKMNGFVRNGEFGFDELRVLDPQGNIGIVWYGETHGESLESSASSATPQISHPDRASITTIMSGGAQSTDKWVRFATTGSWVTAEVYYKDDPTEFSVNNYMDFLPIGANTLILPKAKDISSLMPDATNTSQFKGQVGQIHALDVAGKEAMHLNAGIVYGKYLTEGNLDYFHRYVIPLNDGNYVLVDSFKAKAGKEDKIQEFWYSYKNPDDTCHGKANDVLQTIDTDGSLLLTPRCNNLLRNDSVESYGRIKVASLQPGEFVLGAPDFMSSNPYFNRFIEDNGLYMINRIGRKDRRRLARFVPESDVSEDVRVFLLQSSTSAAHANASIVKSDCGDGICFNVSIDSGDAITLRLDKVENQYVLAGTDLSERVNLVVEEPPVIKDGTLLNPVNFSVSHPNRVSEPEKLFDEQDAIIRPDSGDSLPELRATGLTVSSSSLPYILPKKLAVATDSPYGRSIYVDGNGDPLSASFTMELEALSTINELMYYDISSALRPGQFKISVSNDNQSWTMVHDGITGEYKKWVSINMNNVEAKYIRFDFPEENSARWITELLIYGTNIGWGEEELIVPSNVTSPYPQRFRDFTQLFDEQIGMVEKPLHLAALPEYRSSVPDISYSASSIVPIRKSVTTNSPYGRYIYVDENDDPMLGTVIITLSKLYQLTEIFYYDMSSFYRPGRLEISYSDDNQNWTSFYNEITGEYKKWISIPLNDISAEYIKLDFHEENAAKAMTEMLIYGRPAL